MSFSDNNEGGWDNKESWSQETRRLALEEMHQMYEERRNYANQVDHDKPRERSTSDKPYKEYRIVNIFKAIVGGGIIVLGFYVQIYTYIHKKFQEIEDRKLVNSLNETEVRTKLCDGLSVLQSDLNNLKLIPNEKKLILYEINHTKNFLKTAPLSVDNEECIKRFKRTISDIVNINNAEKSKEKNFK